MLGTDILIIEIECNEAKDINTAIITHSDEY